MTAHRFAQLAVAGAGLLALANSFASSALADPLGHTCGALESALRAHGPSPSQ